MLSVHEDLRETARRQILSELRGGPRSVNDLVRVTGLRQPNVSNHLARMRAKGLVRFSKVGRQVYYNLATPEIEAAVNAVLAVKMGCCESKPICPLVDRFAHAAVEGDELAANEVLDEAFRFNAGLVDIYQDLMLAAMIQVRTWFEEGTIDTGHEHMASEVTLRMMARASQLACPSKPNGKVCVLGSAPQSWHVVPLRMAADLLRVSGWKPLYLGPSVRTPCFVNAVRTHQPDLVLTNCCASEDASAVLELIRELKAARTEDNLFGIGVGGRMVKQNPEMFREAGADLIIPDLRTFACKQLPSL